MSKNRYGFLAFLRSPEGKATIFGTIAFIFALIAAVSLVMSLIEGGS